MENLQRALHANEAEQPGFCDTAFAAALLTEAALRTERFIAGIRRYRAHPAKRDIDEAPVIFKMGNTSLRDYNPRQPAAPIVVIVPSLINRFDILDLDSDLSFVRTLADAGFRPLLLDWDKPDIHEQAFSTTDYIMQRVLPACAFAHRQNGPVHLLGYCMGGLLALGAVTLRPDLVRDLVLMATPWDFHADQSQNAGMFGLVAENLHSVLKGFGSLPTDLIQCLFASMQPLQALTKFASFGDIDPSSRAARHFVLIEDWLNDGVPLSGPVARECLGAWYGENTTAHLKWKVADITVDPRRIDKRTHIVVPGRDRIVAPEGARALHQLIPRSRLIEPMTGHIGLMASHKARSQVWLPLINALRAEP